MKVGQIYLTPPDTLKSDHSLGWFQVSESCKSFCLASISVRYEVPTQFWNFPPITAIVKGWGANLMMMIVLYCIQRLALLLNFLIWRVLSILTNPYQALRQKHANTNKENYIRKVKVIRLDGKQSKCMNFFTRLNDWIHSSWLNQYLSLHITESLLLLNTQSQILIPAIIRGVPPHWAK